MGCQSNAVLEIYEKNVLVLGPLSRKQSLWKQSKHRWNPMQKEVYPLTGQKHPTAAKQIAQVFFLDPYLTK